MASFLPRSQCDEQQEVMVRRRFPMLLAGFLSAVTSMSFSGTAESTGSEARTVPTFEEKRGAGTEECPDGQYCWYNNPLFNQGREDWLWRARNSQPDLGRSPGSSDEAESVVNKTKDPITLYEHWRYGRCITVPAGGAIDDLDKYGLRNNVTSIHQGPEFVCPSWGYVAS
jgi:hypothetical protein